MIAEPLIYTPPIKEEVWICPENLIPSFCDHAAQLLEQRLLPVLQKHDLKEAAIILQALINSGTISSICQAALIELNTAFNCAITEQAETGCNFITNNLFGGLLHVLSLLHSGQEAMAIHTLRNFRFTEADNANEVLLARFLLQKFDISTDWEPYYLVTSENCSSWNMKGLKLIRDDSLDTALEFYTNMINNFDEETFYEDFQEDYIAQRGILYLMQGDLASAEKDIQMLFQKADAENYILLNLAHKWLSSVPVPTLY